MAAPPKKPTQDYSDEPARSPRLRINNLQPFNAEPLLKDLANSGWITDDKVFLSRNHAPIPRVDEATFRLEITGLVSRPLELSISALRNEFPRHEVVSTIQCAGNRRNEFTKKVKQVRGVGWEGGALGTGAFAGALLRDVLLRAGVEESDLGMTHVNFEGLDDCYEIHEDKLLSQKYAASIPLSKALNAYGDVLLAYDMNGAPLTRDRGFPLRVVVPGHIGARSVKWLKRITVQREESASFYQRYDYKLFLPKVDWSNVGAMWDITPSIQELSVQSVILDPNTGDMPGAVPYTIRGFALAGGGRRITRVDISLDGGKTWDYAKIADPQVAKYGEASRYWAWVLWSYPVERLPVPCDIVCKAWDAAGNTQPEDLAPIWNLRGVMNNAWFKVRINDPALQATAPASSSSGNKPKM